MPEPKKSKSKTKTKKVKDKTKKPKKGRRRATQHQEVKQSVRINIGDRNAKDRQSQPQAAPIIFNPPQPVRSDDGGTVRALLEFMRGGAVTGPGVRDFAYPPHLLGGHGYRDRFDSDHTYVDPIHPPTPKPRFDGGTLRDMWDERKVPDAEVFKDPFERKPLVETPKPSRPDGGGAFGLSLPELLEAKARLRKTVKEETPEEVAKARSAAEMAKLEEERDKIIKDRDSARDDMDRERLEKELQTIDARIKESGTAGPPVKSLRETMGDTSERESDPSLTDILSRKSAEDEEREEDEEHEEVKGREEDEEKNGDERHWEAGEGVSLKEMDNFIRFMLKDKPIVVSHKGVKYEFNEHMSSVDFMELVSRLKKAGYISKRGTRLPIGLTKSIQEREIGPLGGVIFWLRSQED